MNDSREEKRLKDAARRDAEYRLGFVTAPAFEATQKLRDIFSLVSIDMTEIHEQDGVLHFGVPQGDRPVMLDFAIATYNSGERNAGRPCAQTIEMSIAFVDRFDASKQLPGKGNVILQRIRDESHPLNRLLVDPSADNTEAAGWKLATVIKNQLNTL